ncbi:toll/interleukin-1 receptor domain-containing protein [Microbacterium sp. AG238]|uniref:toll/interleukin-1 receptor domain-containing protein n=1 Tax=Microbacterium sp. AG238 TaxID=2183994 RepID=UPI000E72CD5A|nr:toll/interleukin-1 receptor domain-containing protein [Microbacterium sp. AG238]RKE60518.1 TIR domain-containing protein [Microbacterium sp. AG238]
MPIDVEKLELLRTIANALAERTLTDVNLLLHEAGLQELAWGHWQDDHYEVTDADRARAVLELIRDLPRADVDELALAVRQLFEVSIEVQAEKEATPLFLFASHLASQRALTGEVGEHLARWGVKLFVAHDSIEPDEEWQPEIERALRTADAGVVFLFPGFIESRWCDQEVGWLLGREVPTYALKFQGEDPYGPLGKKQAFTVRSGMTAAQVGDAIMDWIATKPALASGLDASLVAALQASGSFRKTDQIWERLHSASGLGVTEVGGLLTAVRDNDQVYNARGGIQGGETGPYAELVFKLAIAQPGFDANADLAREVARVRGLESLMPAHLAPEPDPWNRVGDDSPF